MACHAAVFKRALKPHVQAVKARMDNGSVITQLQKLISQHIVFSENSVWQPDKHKSFKFLI